MSDCPVCLKEMEKHAEWERRDCAAEREALERAGLPMTASFLNPESEHRRRPTPNPER